MDVDEKYFSNITSRERAIFEGAISMGALFHQFVGTPVNKSSKKSLETSMEESLKLQPAIEDVDVKIRFDKLEESMSDFDYTSLTGDMLDVKIYTIWIWKHHNIANEINHTSWLKMQSLSKINFV